MAYEGRMLRLLRKAIENGSARRDKYLQIKVEGEDILCILEGESIAIWHRDTNCIPCGGTGCPAGYRAINRNKRQFCNAVMQYLEERSLSAPPEP